MASFSPAQIAGLLVVVFGFGMAASAPTDLASLAAGLACVIAGFVPFHPTNDDDEAL